MLTPNEVLVRVLLLTGMVLTVVLLTVTLLGTIGGLRVTKPVGPKNVLKKLKVSVMIEEVAFKSATT